MEIEQHGTGDIRTLALSGRLDSRWADHVTAAIAAALRDGAHQITLDLDRVSFVSSAGLRTLLQAHKQIAAARGQLHVSNVSPEARTVLELSGLDSLLAPAPISSPTTTHPGFDSATAHWTPLAADPSSSFTAQLWGHPPNPTQASQTISLGSTTSALGLGSAGPAPVGEFLHAGSTLFFLPSDGAGSPDFVQATADRTTTVFSPYGASFEGTPALTLRFSQKPDVSPIPWSEIVHTLGTQLSTDRFGLTLLAETASIVGATLIAPPNPADSTRLDFPQIRDTLSFTTEPAFTRHLALIVAWVEPAQPGTSPNPFLRPITPGSPCSAHAHTVILPYRPIPRDLTDLTPFLTSILQDDSPESVLHLLTDPRDDGVGDSRFTRGVLWAGPIGTVKGNTP